MTVSPETVRTAAMGDDRPERPVHERKARHSDDLISSCEGLHRRRSVDRPTAVSRGGKGLACAGGLAPLYLAGTPWWGLILVAVLLSVIWLVASTLPQRSRDRLDWWIAFWHRNSRKGGHHRR
jgi:hypothetical protein